MGVRLAVLAAGLAEVRAFVAPVAFEALVEPAAAFGAASATVPADFALRRRPDEPEPDEPEPDDPEPEPDEPSCAP